MFFTMLFSVTGIIVGVLLVMYLVNKRSLNKTLQAGGAQVDKVGNFLWSRDPAAVYQKIVDDATQEISDATEAIEENRALVTGLSRQVEDGRREIARVDAKIKLSLSDDPQDTNGRAADYVKQLQTAKEHLAKNEAQYTQVNNLYQFNIKKVNAARDKIKDAEDHGRQMGIELKMAQTQAKIAKLATKFNVNGLNTDGLAEVTAEMQRQIDKANAVSQVQADMGLDGMKELEEEERLRKAEGKNLLEDYKKNMGTTTTPQ